MSRGRGNSFYVMHSSSTEPTVSIPIHRLPDPLPGACCDVDNPFFIDDLYRIGEIPGPFDFFGPTSTEWQVLYEYKFLDGRLTRPRAIMAFETQYGPTHNGGAMLTLGNGKILFSPGDGLIQPHAQYGRNDPNGGIAITGAVTSFRSFDEITTMFSDLDSGVPYATTASPLDTDVTVYRVNLVDENDEPVADLNELTEGRRSDPRFFRFPNGKAGVLREGSGSYYMLEELD